ncbi:MAG: alpha/beta hydrolase family protein [Gemmatimonadales bacterium]
MGWFAHVRGRILPVLLLIGAACGGSSDVQSPADDGESPAVGCHDGTLGMTPALYRVCFPDQWNGDLVVYAHGYVQPGASLALPDDRIGQASISSVVNGLGYAFATTSYRANGLVAADAVEDVADLTEEIRRLYRPDPNRTYVVGVSEGGLVAALAMERHADLFAGAVAACGPIGDFRRQIDYFEDMRVVFDYFFPGVVPGSAVDIPDSVRARWNARYAPAVSAALAADSSAARQILAVTGAPIDAADPTSAGQTVVGVLWYNIFATDDAQQRLGGQPYENAGRVYAGSDDDAALNAGVARHAADAAARANLESLETSGQLSIPVVTLHTTGDPIVPFLQEALYADRVAAAGASGLLEQRAVTRYGHCAFQPDELLGAFDDLVGRVTASALPLAGR